MPTNRHMTFSDRQAEAARLKKLQQMATAPAPTTPNSGQESVQNAPSQSQTSSKAAPKKAAKKTPAPKPVASKKAAAASKKKSGKGK
ncbi:MAG TPA: hypothetical protein VFP40_17845 [Terriglobales bacterium]|nr:hypothetical protein [Terriglobales bacterium]